MIRTTIKVNNIHCVVYKPVIPSTNWLIFAHGLGEVGPADGSQLAKVDANGYPKHAKGGFEFPFNIIVPQIPNTQYADYWLLTGTPGASNEGWFVNYVKEVLGASEIQVSGLSLGGRGSWSLLRYDVKGYIKAIAPVCGYYESNQGPFCNLRSIPGYSWHHQNDMVMNYQWDKGGVDAYNACSNNQKTQLIDGVVRPLHYLNTLTFATSNPHDAWTSAYSIEVGKNSLLTWIEQQFSPIVIPAQDPIVKNYWDGVNLVFETQSGLVIKK